MKCKCWSETQEKLKSLNLKMVGATYLMPGFTLVPVIATEWIDKSKAPKGHKLKPTAMLASHCPFCGTKIENQNDMDTLPTARNQTTAETATVSPVGGGE